MPTPPSQTLLLHDRDGALFGSLHLAPGEDPRKGECIFQVSPHDDVQAHLPEVRWLLKRDFRKHGEHRYTLDNHEGLTVFLAEFRVAFGPGAGGRQRSLPPAPLVWADWKLD